MTPDKPTKPVREKTLKELETDILSAKAYEDQKQQMKAQGEAAKAELLRRKAKAINEKGGLDRLVSQRGREAINHASKHALGADEDVILMAIVVDNTYAKNDESRLDEQRAIGWTKAEFDKHLPNGTRLSAISLQQMWRHKNKDFSSAFTQFVTSCDAHNRMKANLLGNEHRQSVGYYPDKHIPEW